MDDQKKSRDIELDQILAPLRQAQPDRLQLERWQNLAPLKVLKHRRSWELALAACAGFLLGALIFWNLNKVAPVDTNFDPTATIEVVYHKGE